MTSRNLFFKLMKEDLKRRLWAIGFSVLALFFAMPMAAAMGIGEIGNQYKQWLISGTGYENMVPEALRQTKILRFAGEILGFENYALFMVVGAAAMILGLTGFLYLHSKKQIDFYNSLPVKREMLFTVKFLDGFLIILAAYLINMFAAFGIFCGNGIAAGDLFKMMFASFAVNMIGFLLIYVVMVIAVLLTGNLFISILGAGVLYGYLPAVSLLIEGLKSLFFVTRGREGDVYWLAKYGSPIGYFTKLAGAGLDAFHSDQFYDDIDYGFSRIQMELQSTADSGAELLKLCGLGIFAAVILTGIALVLYRIRPSEAAGKAMSFKKTQAPIKILLLIPMTVTTTVFLWSIYYSGVWAAVGFTGNLFISILGAGVLYGYLPAVSLLIEGLKSLFFVTRGREGDVYWLAKYGSPIGYFTKLAGAGLDAFHSDQFYDDIDYGFSRIQMELQSTADSGAELLKLCGLGIFAAVILTGIALVLYRIRPSEAAGKAMSFKKTQAPIKILLLIPMTVTTTVFLWSIYYSGVWAAVGFVLGLVLTSCLIEIIYHFDFTKLFANPVQTVIGGAIAILVVGGFWMDVFGYDSYIPDEKDFVSASIDLNLDNEPDCGLPYRSGDSYRWRYMNSSDYADANMKLTDYAVVHAFAEKAVENAKQQRNQQIKGDSSYSYRDDGGYMIYIQAGYRQKNGKTVYRSYRITRSVLGSTLDEIYATKEYKDGTYPVMSYQPENITGIYWLSDRGILEVSADDTLRAEILAAYQEELAGLTINERAVEAPVAALRFLTKAENEYLGAISTQRGYTSQGFQMEDMQIVNFVPVYPSFTKTIALLKQAGTDVTAKLSVDDVTQVKILYPTEYESTAAGEDAVTGEDDPIREDGGGVTAEAELKAVSYGGQKMITIVNDGSEENRRKIEEILSASAPEIMLDRNRLCTYEMGIEIDVSIKPDSAFSSGNGTVDERVYRIMGDTVPECIEKALNYSKISTKYVRKGIGVMKND